MGGIRVRDRHRVVGKKRRDETNTGAEQMLASRVEWCYSTCMFWPQQVHQAVLMQHQRQGQQWQHPPVAASADTTQAAAVAAQSGPTCLQRLPGNTHACRLAWYMRSATWSLTDVAKWVVKPSHAVQSPPNATPQQTLQRQRYCSNAHATPPNESAADRGRGAFQR
jgi:hypothetical protein